MDESGGGNVIWLVIGLAVLLLLVGLWLRERMLRSRAKNWPTVSGMVEASDIRVERRGATQAVHVAEIAYTYEVEGISYQGCWKRSAMLRNKTGEWIKLLPPGTKIRVSHNPQIPSQSMLLDNGQD